MNARDFEDVVGKVMDNIQDVLSAKSDDYASETDKLHNFKRAAKVGETTPAKALLGMKLKHDVSILDIIDKVEKGFYPTDAYLMEKFGDAINYQILLLAVIMESRKQP